MSIGILTRIIDNAWPKTRSGFPTSAAGIRSEISEVGYCGITLKELVEPGLVDR